ncbi:MAG: putative 2OG-Fe(II) oxygenase [Xanthobacteraceae bacterium]
MTRMGAFTPVRLETAKRLTALQELQILRNALAHSPGSRDLRGRFVEVANQCDCYRETLAVLAEASDIDFTEAMMRVRALLALEEPNATLDACSASNFALSLARNDADRAVALADRGKAERRLELPEARDTLIRALELDSHNKDACKRLAALHFSRNDPEAALAMTDTLAKLGVGHSRLIAARVVALARLGKIDAAREADGLERLQLRLSLPPPPGWNSREEFNAALAAELLAHPALHLERYGSASYRTLRIDSVISDAAPLARQLLAQIAAIAESHVAAISAIDHLMIRVRPPALTLHSWCAIVDDDGFETWHVHQRGWMSGVYYPAAPEAVATATDERGHIAFGLPEDLVGEQTAREFGIQLVRPEPGMLILFPSHTYHRTFPHRADGRRICIAFDFWPGR